MSDFTFSYHLVAFLFLLSRGTASAESRSLHFSFICPGNWPNWLSKRCHTPSLAGKEWVPISLLNSNHLGPDANYQTSHFASLESIQQQVNSFPSLRVPQMEPFTVENALANGIPQYQPDGNNYGLPGPILHQKLTFVRPQPLNNDLNESELEDDAQAPSFEGAIQKELRHFLDTHLGFHLPNHESL